MYRFLLVLVVISLMTVLGCGGSTNETPPPAEEVVEQASAPEPVAEVRHLRLRDGTRHQLITALVARADHHDFHPGGFFHPASLRPGVLNDLRLCARSPGYLLSPNAPGEASCRFGHPRFLLSFEIKSVQTHVEPAGLFNCSGLLLLRSIAVGPGRWRGTAVLLVMVLVFPATVPILVGQTDASAVPGMCNCGCDNPEGSCCCSARPTSPLAMRCAGSSEPDASSPHINPLIGPPGPVLVPMPEFSSRESAPLQLLTADIGHRPEIPPPRA